MVATKRILTEYIDSRKDLPSVSTPNYDQRMLQTVREMLGKDGDPLNSVVTVGQLIKSGIATVNLGSLGGGKSPPLQPGPVIPPDDKVDMTPPPTPTGFTATAGITTILVEHDPPIYTQGHGHGRAILYGAIYDGTGPLPTFADAVQLAEFEGSPYAYSTNPATTFHLWLKWVTNDGVASIAPAGGTNGVVVRTGEDVRLLLDAITQAAEDPTAPFSRFAIRAGLFYVANDVTASSAPVFSVVTSPFIQNGVPVPAGVYFRDGYIMNGTITNAKIANLAVDDAKISSLSVGKLRAGSIAVGEFIQSTNYIANSQGWRINGNGTAEFSGVIVRGTIYATAGEIGGSILGADFIRSRTYVAGSSGWRLNSDGTGQIGGFAVGTNYIQSTNFVPGFGGLGWRLNANGNIELNSGVFRGTLDAVNGTFSGSLTAQAINAVQTINIAGNAVTVPTVQQRTSPSEGIGYGLWTTVVTAFVTLPVDGQINIAATGFVGYGTGWRMAGTRLLVNGSVVSTHAIAEAYTTISHNGMSPAFPGNPVTAALQFSGDAGCRLEEATITMLAVKR